MDDKNEMPINFLRYDISCYYWNNEYDHLILLTGLILLSLVIKKLSNSVIQSTTSNSLFQRIWRKLVSIFVWNLLYFVLLYFFIHSLLSGFIEIYYGRINSFKGAINLLFGVIGIAANLFLTLHLFIMVNVMKPI